MSDPQRLLSDASDADDLERELLASIRRLTPPGDAKQLGWARISAQIAAVGLVTGAHASAAASGAAAPAATLPVSSGLASASAWGGLTGKLALGAALTTFAVAGSAYWVHARRPVASVAIPAPKSIAPSPRSYAADPAPSIALPAEVSVAPAPRPEAPVRRSVEPSLADRLSAESALLTKARAELRSGDAAAAQRSLDQLRRQYPNGVLGQEREVLSIQVLAARGDSEAARRRARAFIAAYPKSPHSALLTRLAETP